MPEASPLNLLAEEFGAIAGRIEREINLRLLAAIAEFGRREAEVGRHVAEFETRFSALERMVTDRLVNVKDGSNGIDGKDGAPGRDGIDGAAGRDGTNGERGEKGLDGQNGERGENGEQGQKGDPGEKGDPGQQGTCGDQGIPGEKGERGEKGAAGALRTARSFVEGDVYYDGDIVLHHGSSWQARCDTAHAPPHEDWLCIAARGKDAVMPKIVGTYREGEPYSFMNIVALGGSSFMARADDPGPCPGDGWQLIASAGRQGKPGPQGERGLPGACGERGLPGIVPTVLGWKIDRAAYSATPIMSDDSAAEPLQLRALFEQFQDETR
jgi:hypothetical protein